VAALNKKNKYKITVLTPFNYMEIPVVMTKVLATGSENHQKALHPLLRENHVEYIVDRCIELRENSALTAGGKSLSFDLCVLGKIW
jgi:hypothetical protein